MPDRFFGSLTSSTSATTSRVGSCTSNTSSNCGLQLLSRSPQSSPSLSSHCSLLCEEPFWTKFSMRSSPNSIDSAITLLLHPLLWSIRMVSRVAGVNVLDHLLQPGALCFVETVSLPAARTLSRTVKGPPRPVIGSPTHSSILNASTNLLVFAEVLPSSGWVNHDQLTSRYTRASSGGASSFGPRGCNFHGCGPCPAVARNSRTGMLLRLPSGSSVPIRSQSKMSI
mmetsp:Transcript_29839/g.86642  ORF Transcript_29839/g.86642 Transcript_29839/m.86642 type:complete len:226 (+) Transcript_29839:509-1186(+)